ncbi:MAG: transglutaminase domain-containing protein [Coriobacteriales bacterium]|nr:transglutaminase domain-containing protein [Coriobacteriales bacterium]
MSADSSARANPGNPRDNTPQVLVAEQPGTAVAAVEGALLDFSNAANGYVCAVSYLGNTKVKVLVNSPDSNQYQYTITSGNAFITIPLTRGNGIYTIGIYENLYDDQYAALLSQDVAVELVDEFAPFLYPNQIVNFSAGDATVQLSQQVTENATSEVEAVDQIYMYVVQNFSYDYDKADSVVPGYIPTNSDMLASQMGICYDFASLTASMMRAQRLPTRLDVGYCGQAYHAWIEVYTSDTGWVRKQIQFSGGSWVLMDPTFDSSGKGTGDVSKIIGDGKNYQPILYY